MYQIPFRVACIALSILFLSHSAFSQIPAFSGNFHPKLYWVTFADKGNHSEFNPTDFFDPLAVDRRNSAGIKWDESDIPVCAAYLTAIKNSSSELIENSRWLNGCAVLANDFEVETIRALSFVKSVYEVVENPDHFSGPCSLNSMPENQMGTATADGMNKLVSIQQRSMGLSHWKSHAITGRGIRVAVFDAGFPDVDSNPAFDHLRKNGRILATKNFLNGRKKVFGRNFHGTSVLSCITGIKDGEPLGMATEAEFLLAITEYGVREPFREELFWLKAAEWADEKGAHIISSSLGYGKDRYFFRDMDGHTSLVARAAGKAAAKGILVVNSAGNEGTDSWKMIITPADNDSVLAVGGINPKTGYHINFSSFGPNYAGKTKPNVSAPGDVIAAKGNGFTNIQGTSFSCPLVSGFAACLLQYKPELIGKPLQAMSYIESISSLFPYYDFAHGHGLPLATKVFYPNTQNDALFSLQSSAENDAVNVVFSDLMAQNEEIKEWTPPLYIKYLTPDGRILRYELISLDNFTGKEYGIGLNPAENVHSLEVHYAGKTKRIILPAYSK